MTSLANAIKYCFSALCVVLTACSGSAADGPIPWTLKGPGTGISLRPGDGIPIAVTVGATAASNIKLIQSGVVEQTSKRLLGLADLELCANMPDGSCSPVGTVPASSSDAIWLRPKTGAAPGAGHFVGPVTISSSLKPEGETVNLDIYVTSTWRRLLGALAILSGAVLAWLVAVGLRGRFNRDQLLIPAALLRERLQRIGKILDVVPNGQKPAWVLAQSHVHVNNRINEQLARIQDARLEADNLIPRWIPNPFSGAAPVTDDYKRLLQQVDDWVAALQMMVEDGMRVAWGLAPANPAPEVQGFVNAAVTAIDSLVAAVNAPAPSLTTVMNQIQTALTTLRNHLPGGQGPVGGAAPGTAYLSRSFDQLRLDLSRVSVAGWIITLIVTVLVGTYVVVLSNLGFGVWTDYFACLFWGLGLPAGAALLNQTTQSVSTALGISLTR